MGDCQKSHRGRRDQEPGFTLIELLVVISVIAVLMAILMPVLGRVRKQARAIACQANLRQWGMAMHVYTQDNEGRRPTGGGGDQRHLAVAGKLHGPGGPQHDRPCTAPLRHAGHRPLPGGQTCRRRRLLLLCGAAVK
jgi:prepilin-type N-terminal cleavage/methylation domain-containing protein